MTAKLFELTAQRPRDLLFETVAEVCEIDMGQLTKSARGALNKACSELRELNPDPDEIRKRAEMYRQKYEGIPLTPNALAKHWPMLNPPKEDRWKLACRIANENGLPPFKGAPQETPEQFMQRIGV